MGVRAEMDSSAGDAAGDPTVPASSRSRGGEALLAAGFLLFEVAQFFARPTLTTLSPTQDVVVLAAQALVALLALALARPGRGSGSGDMRGRALTVRVVAVVAVVTSALGQVVIFMAPRASGLGPAYAGSVLSGTGVAAGYLAWLALFLRMPDRRRASLLLLCLLAASRLVVLAVRLVGAEGMWLIFGFGCLDASLASMLACVLARAGAGRASARAPMPARSGVPARARRAYVTALLGMALYALLFGVITQVHNNTQALTVATDLFSSVFSCALYVALAVRVALSRRPLDIGAVFLVTVLGIAGVMALAALIGAGVSDMADVMVKTCFSLYQAALCVFLLQRPASDGSPLFLAALAYSVQWCFTLLGSGLGLALLSFTQLSATVVMAVLLGAMWLCMLVSVVLARAGAAGAADDAPAGKVAPEPQVVYVDRVTEQVRLLAEACGLSDREREVALLFVRGRSAARIAEGLTLSENTVKTHLQNIYAKLGVHTKQQLIDRVAEREVG